MLFFHLIVTLRASSLCKENHCAVLTQRRNGIILGYKFRYAANLSGVINGSPYKVLLVRLLYTANARSRCSQLFWTQPYVVHKYLSYHYLILFHHFQEGYDFIVGTSEHGETNISLSSSYLHLGIPSAYILDYHREKKTDLVVWMCNFFLRRWHGVSIYEAHFSPIH